MPLRVAIDTGRTFTDAIALDEATGDQFAIKTPSTPKRGGLSMFDRGDYVAEARARGALDSPDGWEDPDDGWWAETVAEAAQ